MERLICILLLDKHTEFCGFGLIDYNKNKKAEDSNKKYDTY